MKIILLFITAVVTLSACQTTHKNASNEQVYNPFNPQLTHTSYLGPMPSIRPPNMDKTK